VVDAVGPISKRFAMQLSATLVKCNAVLGKKAKEGGIDSILLSVNKPKASPAKHPSSAPRHLLL